MQKYRVIHEDVFCTMVASYVYEGRGGGPGGSLKACVEKYARFLFERVNKEVREVFINMDEHPEDWNRTFTEEELEYMELDIHCVREVYFELQRRLDQPSNHKVQKVIELENKLVPVVVAMENRGIFIDKEKWSGIIQGATSKREEIKEALDEFLLRPWLEMKKRQWQDANKELEAWALSKHSHEVVLKALWQDTDVAHGMPWGKFKLEQMKLWRDQHPRPKATTQPVEEFNLDSHIQLKEAFFCAFGLTLESTEADEVEKAKNKAARDDAKEALSLLLDYKGFAKMISTYGESLLAKVGNDNRIYPHFNQVGTDTGRFSCNNPNVQNIPQPRKSGDLRACFVAPEGYSLLVSDLSAAEMRILADLSKDKELLDVFTSEKDIHAMVAMKAFKLPQHVDPAKTYFRDGVSYRKAAKTIGYGLAYGAGPRHIAEMLGIATDEAKELMSLFFGEFHDVKRYLDECAKFGVDNRYSETVLGRRRIYRLPPLPRSLRIWNGRALWMGKQDEEGLHYKELLSSVQRNSKNHPMQGGQADVIKMALVDLHNNLKGTEAYITNVVHDEVIIECPNERIEEVKCYIQQAMTKGFTSLYPTVHFPIPEVKVSQHWEHD